MANRSTPRSRESTAQILDALLTTKGTLLRSQAARNAPSPADAEDALMEACLQFLRYYNGPPGVHALRWLMLCVKHRAWEIVARRRSREALGELSCTDAYDPDGHTVHVPCQRPGPAERAERGEEVTEFFTALDRLKPDERTALLLLGFGLSYREIMHRQGWGPTKLNRCLAEGRAAIRTIDSGKRFE
ncbi:MAG TPA: sigma-70 family RNA polymerase sigma factor [Solirubrobacterales bacterium]|nr:sigma-70 family RNA polymerase sigma factor [Solirubrobacterales bacterium]